MMHIRWVSLKTAFLGMSGQNLYKTTVSPRSNRVFLVSKRTLYYFGEKVVIPGQLSLEFANIGGWLTYGD